MSNGLKLYIATSLLRRAEQQALVAQLRALGHTITHDWGAGLDVGSEGAARMQEIAQAEVNGVADADILIVLLPGRRGTHVELGIALALDKPIFVVGPEELRVGSDICPFYHHGAVAWHTTLDAMLVGVEGMRRARLLPLLVEACRDDNDVRRLAQRIEECCPKDKADSFVSAAVQAAAERGVAAPAEQAASVAVEACYQTLRQMIPPV